MLQSKIIELRGSAEQRAAPAPLTRNVRSSPRRLCKFAPVNARTADTVSARCINIVCERTAKSGNCIVKPTSTHRVCQEYPNVRRAGPLFGEVQLLSPPVAETCDAG